MSKRKFPFWSVSFAFCSACTKAYGMGAPVTEFTTVPVRTCAGEAVWSGVLNCANTGAARKAENREQDKVRRLANDTKTEQNRMK